MSKWQRNILVKRAVTSGILFTSEKPPTNQIKKWNSNTGLFFINFLLDQGPFCGATYCSCFWLRVSFLVGFKSRLDLLPALILAYIWWSWRSCLKFPGVNKFNYVNCISLPRQLLQRPLQRGFWLRLQPPLCDLLRSRTYHPTSNLFHQTITTVNCKPLLAIVRHNTYLRKANWLELPFKFYSQKPQQSIRQWSPFAFFDEYANSQNT